VNNFSYGNQWIIRAGDPNVLTFQVVDLDQGPAQTIGNQIFGAPSLSGNIGLRYMVGVSTLAAINVTFPSIDDAQVITVPAVQDPNDKSIWTVTLGPNQKPNSGNVIFAITEGSATRRFSALDLLKVEYPQNDGSC
jgi:hypothetical protein